MDDRERILTARRLHALQRRAGCWRIPHELLVRPGLHAHGFRGVHVGVLFFFVAVRDRPLQGAWVRLSHMVSVHAYHAVNGEFESTEEIGVEILAQHESTFEIEFEYSSA